MADRDDASAYADLLAALITAYSDPASARFDAELAAAEARGEVHGEAARTLRWWQRQSVRGLEEHLTTVLPVLLARLAAADDAAHESVAAGAASWALATEASSSTRPPAHPVETSASRTVPSGPVVLHARRGPGAEPEVAQAPPPSTVAPFRPGSPPPAPTAVAAPPNEAGSPNPVGFTASAERGAPRQRLLVAGLTVLTDDTTPPAPPATP
jgi:hypothetical protein